MRDTLSPVLETALNQQNTGEQVVFLLMIDHPEFSQPVRLCNERQEIVSNGETYVPFPFALTLPDDKEGGSPRGKIEFDNVSREITAWLLELAESPTVEIQVALFSQPDVVEFVADDFVLENPTWTADRPVISADLVIHDLTQEPAQQHRLSPSTTPGLG